MENNFLNGHRQDTAAGTLLVIVLQINWDSLLSTAILAAIGATVSFCISLLWKYISSRFK